MRYARRGYRFGFAAILSMAILGAAHAIETIDGGTVTVAEIEETIPELMEEAWVAGLSIAVISGGNLEYVRAFGFRDRDAGSRPDEETVFGGASFSKTVFAWLVMSLAEERIIDLDRPLYEYLEKPLPEYPKYTDLAHDSHYKRITARHVLSHTTGFPNWRFFTPENRLSFLFPPGERFSYSGEGIALLQMVVEEIMERDLEDLAQEMVFRPFGMSRTSYVWQDAWEANHARPHNQYNQPRNVQHRRTAEAAGSMWTTAGDYARFLVGILGAEEKRRETANAMLERQVEIRSERMFGPGAIHETGENEGIRLSWGLGWGCFRTSDGRAFFHTGHDIGFQNYTVTHADRRIGIVCLSNSDNFESIAEEVVRTVLGQEGSPFRWLGYEAFDPTVERIPPPERVAIEVDVHLLTDFPGAYRLPDGDTLRVKIEEGALLFAGSDGDWSELLAESETRFFIDGNDYMFTFVRDESGSTTGLDLEVDGMLLHMTRIE